MLNVIVRAIFFIMGLVFAASIAVAALLLLAVFIVRLGLAKLSGKPVTSWAVMFGKRFDPRAGFDRFRAAASRRGGPRAADVASARARGESVNSPTAEWRMGRHAEGDVTDVRARPVADHG